MTCYHPVDVFVKRKPIYTGARRISGEQTVPCGHCLGCRGDQARDWSIRIMHELQMHRNAWFVTLTYKDEEIPENGSLYPEDFRRFIKALRRSEKAPLSYYACGEYGDTTKRPHYHAVLFGPEFLDRSVHRDTDGPVVWRSPTLESAWTVDKRSLGHSEFGTVTPQSAAYVAGYVRKKIRVKDDPNGYTRVDPRTGELVEIQKEFSRMSLKPAVGKRWIEKYWQDVYPRDFVVVEGREMRPPRFYDKWLEANHPEMMMEVRLKRYEETKELEEEKLQAKEKIHEAKVGLFQQRGKV